ncbi:putative FBD-associated F-box protein At5g50270 isoform X2 [Spinacia oleracea]|nr:putative FBD-associated F-box protein At5g50270 isoform X2 [Spinacia oleracea]
MMDRRNNTGNIDMLSSLPDELLIRILSLLPTTKDAAIMCLVSKKMKCLFSWITTLDLDDSPISHCSQHPYAIERFSDYKMFVDSLLNSYQSPYLSRFRLRVGANFAARYFHGDKTHFWKRDDCFPEIKSTQINAWISFPLTRCGLRELDLRIQDLDFVEEEDMLSLFPNLTSLELGCDVYTTWDKLLLSFLNGSPVLETLIFPEGVIVCHDTNHFAYGKEVVELQQEFFRTTQEVIPMCCRFHLKRIVIKNYFGNEFEIDMIQFLLTHALVLKELVVHRSVKTWHPIVDQKLLKTTLKKLPRASVSCSIQVH